MGKAFSVEVTGLKELGEVLKSLPPEIGSKSGGPLARALRKAAGVVRDDARNRAPIRTINLNGELLPPGRLRKAIVVRRARKPVNGATEGMEVTVRNGKSRSDPNGAYYWKFVEFGTIGKLQPDQEAQPFLRPAFESNALAVVDKFKEVFKDEVDKAAKRAAKKGWKPGG